MARHAVLSDFKEISALRGAGASISTIARRTGFHPRTIARICQRFAITKSTFRKEAIEQARRQLLDESDDALWIKHRVAQLIHDDLDNAQRLRDLAAVLADKIEEQIMDSESLEDFALAARSVVALSTLIKNLHDVRRHIVVDAPEEELMSLPLLVMTPEEVERERWRVENDVDEVELSEEDIPIASA